jgi:hypothetical protein
LFNRISTKFQTLKNRSRLGHMARAVSERAQPAALQPVVFFNASARLGHLSQNAAFSLLAAWGLRLGGLPVLHFVCNSGMSRCVLGTNPDDPNQPPPCAACVAQSERMYAGAQVRWFEYSQQAEITGAISNMNISQLQAYSFNGWPLGEIVLPALRWALRRHNLEDDAGTQRLFREYILSAYNVGVEFSAFLDEAKPQAVVLFNGIMFPEAIARHIALARRLSTITHEVGLRPLTAFFTEGQATAYPMDIPADFQLSEEQNAELDAYLSQRFEGQFTMAGIRFWPQMQELDTAFMQKAAAFKHIVPVFTNVIFDTSQVHANTLFPDMFAWLDSLLPQIKAHTDTLFVIRAHPDEMRPNSRKQSRESVAAWVQQHGVDQLPNVVFVGPTEYLSSYALIQRAHLVLVYNSSIGLEASIMGKPVLSAGAARFTQYKTVFFPKSSAAYQTELENLLNAAEITHPAELIQESRRVLYYQLFRTGLPFDEFLEAGQRMGYVELREFPLDALEPVNSSTIGTIYAGVVSGKPFLV